MIYPQKSLLLFFHYLILACAFLASRTPVAHSPILRIPSLRYQPHLTPCNHFAVIDEAKPAEILFSNSRATMSKARVYTDVNVIRPKEYWDYESLAVQWG